MSNRINKGILIVSFGTSYEETRIKTIDAFVESVRTQYNDYYVYEAWTSRIIAGILMKRDGIYKQTVAEALELMINDGIEEVIIQPTHVINGVENDIMINSANKYKDKFQSIKFGSPLLSGNGDLTRVVDIMVDRFKGLDEANEGVVLMGHGSTHINNSVYCALNRKFSEMGHDNFFVGTVEAWPDIDTIISEVKKTKLKKLYLIPFMMVAGDHANNDMAGDDDSWASRLESEGYQVECILEGLGENEAIRKLLVEHLITAIEG